MVTRDSASTGIFVQRDNLPEGWAMTKFNTQRTTSLHA